MKKLLITVLILGLVSVSLTWTLKATAQGKPKKNPFTDVPIGAVPTEFGDLVNFAGNINNYALVFKSKEGDLRIIEFRGNKLNPRAFLINREY